MTPTTGGADTECRRPLKSGPTVPRSLLNPVTVIEVAGAASFIAKEKFVEGETVDGVKIAQLGKGFKQYLQEREEKNVLPAKIRVWEPEWWAFNANILAALGPEAEIALVHYWELLKKHAAKHHAARSRSLLTNGNSTIAYIGDYTFEACLSSGWYFEAYPTDSNIRWCSGSRFLSRSR